MKSKKLVLFAVAAAFAAVATLPAAAGDGVQQSITFAFTGDASCLVSENNVASVAFDPTLLTSTGPTHILSFTSTGFFTFNAPDWNTLAGTGTAKYTNVGFDNDASGYGFSQSVQLPFTYTVGPGGVLTVTPGTLSFTYLTPPNHAALTPAGTFFFKVGLPPFTGQISLNGTIVLTSSGTSVETLSLGSSLLTSSFVNSQLCHRTRTLVPVL